jgi:hypothetical protein
MEIITEIKNTFDAVNIIEDGSYDQNLTIEAWQHLIDSGVVWSLQGWFGRTAAWLIESGICTPAGDA